MNMERLFIDLHEEVIMEYKIIVTKEKDEEFSEFMHRKIREYNDYTSFHHREVRKPESVEAVNIIVKNSANEWVGGLTAEIYWGWLEIKYFWLHEDFRKKGIGTKILLDAEKVAIAQGCHRAFLSTYEFQGRTFYERNGYRIVGQLDDYPPGSTFYWMKKSI